MSTFTTLPLTQSGSSFLSIPALGATQTRAERTVQVMAIIAWNLGPSCAYDYFTSYVQNTNNEMPVSWLIESMAFPGTNYEAMFNLMCGE